MAAITVGASFDIAGLATHLASRLPHYAVPLFIRIQEEAETTGTFKFRKVDLVEQGFDLDRIDEPVWFLEPGTGQYHRFTPELITRIREAAYRFWPPSNRSLQ